MSIHLLDLSFTLSLILLLLQGIILSLWFTRALPRLRGDRRRRTVRPGWCASVTWLRCPRCWSPPVVFLPCSQHSQELVSTSVFAREAAIRAALAASLEE